MHATAVARLEGILVIRDGDEPIGVLMPYAIYLEMQRTAEAKEKV
jgi:hypothetical protein